MNASKKFRWLLPLLGLCVAPSCSDVAVTAVEVALVQLDPPGASIPLGGSVQLAARVMDGSGNDLIGRRVDWSSSDPDRVPVDETGLVRGLQAGYATITATSADARGTAEIVVNHPRPELTGVEPSSAQRLQTVELVLTGSGFTEGVTTVSLGGGIAVDEVEVVNSGRIAITVTIQPGAQLGSRDVTVSNPEPGGGAGTLAGTFVVLAEHPEPAVWEATPARGQRQETLTVTIDGAGFAQDLTSASFGPAIDVGAVQVLGANRLRATITVGSGAALGPRDIVVTNPEPGGGTARLTDGFTVEPANPVPVATAASPAEGQRQGTLDVAVSGSGFVGGLTTVDFGSGIDVNGLTVQSSSSLRANISIRADAALGERDVRVTNPPPGGGSRVLEGAFNVLPENPRPTVASVEPQTGQRKQTLNVVVTGTGFLAGLTTVSFGSGVTVNSVDVTSSSSLTANITIASGTVLGSRDVRVSNPEPGGGSSTLAGGFTVLEENPAPSVTAAIPEAGTRGVTMNVTLLGSGFVQGLTTVSFGDGITVNSVSVVFWTSLTANITIAPNAAPGPRNVTVSNPQPGGGTFIMHDGFRVL